MHEYLNKNDNVAKSEAQEIRWSNENVVDNQTKRLIYNVNTDRS